MGMSQPAAFVGPTQPFDMEDEQAITQAITPDIPESVHEKGGARHVA